MNDTKTRPILMSGPMVKAILNGRKSQARRIVKPQPDEDGLSCQADCELYPGRAGLWFDTSDRAYRCPYGATGTTLWVRETWRVHGFCDYGVQYRADLFTRNDQRAAAYGTKHEDRWRPSIHMPRWASRLTLEVTGVRVERLQKISDADSHAEGCETPATAARSHFRNLWESINGPGSWDANPCVWVVEFRRVD
jgi:hypothetical protein